MSECLIAFGGNLSNPKVTFQIALKSLCEEGFDFEKKSGLWRSPAWPPGSDQPEYLNAVVKGSYRENAESLLALLHKIEAVHGRVRSVPNAARTLDLDLLTFGDEVSDDENLILPHPRMTERAFVLIPACELETKWIKYTAQLSEADVRQTRYAGSW